MVLKLSIKERFINYENVKFDMIVVKSNFYEEKALDLYVELCRTAYNNIEKLIKENNMLESEK